ncbi:MAG: hypothetical protein KJZ86_16485 [Caldilineaceae bacterium]|nr:hypothetical protein [Caldilineaceae bacterium]
MSSYLPAHLTGLQTARLSSGGEREDRLDWEGIRNSFPAGATAQAHKENPT